MEDLIKRLGLAKSADTVVGDAKTRGISGERLMSSPRLAFRQSKSDFCGCSDRFNSLPQGRQNSASL